MLIDVDTRKPLKFKTKASSPGGEEVTIQIYYDLLFKHCTLCGFLTHEKEYCPTNKDVTRYQEQIQRPGVFARVQLPHDHAVRQPYLNEQRPGNHQARPSYTDRNDHSFHRRNYDNHHKDCNDHVSRYDNARAGHTFKMIIIILCHNVT